VPWCVGVWCVWTFGTQALKDHNDNIGKLTPYLLATDPQVLAAMAKSTVDSANQIRLVCVATRWEMHFIAIWKSTLRSTGKRLSRFNKLNEWFSTNKGDVLFVVPAFWKAARDIIQAGDLKKK
jgi:hypothetical protein